MELSQFTLGLIFIFLPGVLALMVSERLTEHPERKPYELFAYALVLGCVSHLVYPSVQWLVNTISMRLVLEDDRWLELMLEEHVGIQPRVVGTNALIGIGIGLFVAYAANRSWMHRFAYALGISRKFADMDVWAYLMNSENIQWVVIRDKSKNLMYQGAISLFSSGEDPRELLLTNVTVYTNDTGTRLYDAEALYLSFDKKGVELEVQRLEN